MNEVVSRVTQRARYYTNFTKKYIYLGVIRVARARIICGNSCIRVYMYSMNL